MTTPTTGKSAQTPAEAYKSAYDALKSALAAIVQETMEYPPERPFSGDSWLPAHLIEAAQAALQQAAELREPTPVKTQKTVKKWDPDFPYASFTETVRGTYVSADYFDVEPAEVMSPVGAEAFLAMMHLVKTGAPKHRTLGRDVIVSASLKFENDPAKHPTRRWVACSFLNMVDEFLRFAANHADFETYVANRIASDNKSAEVFAQLERERMAKLTRRSIEVRRARKAEKAGSQ